METTQFFSVIDPTFEYGVGYSTLSGEPEPGPAGTILVRMGGGGYPDGVVLLQQVDSHTYRLVDGKDAFLAHEREEERRREAKELRKAGSHPRECRCRYCAAY
jgi:hypothetical protein